MSDSSHKVAFRTRLDKCCDTESSRYALGSVHVCPSKKGGWLTACDGRTMAVVKDETAKIASAALVPAKIAAGATSRRPILAEKTGAFWENDKGKTEREQVGRYPQCSKALPAMPAEYVAVSFDAALVAQLGEALSLPGASKALTLFVPKAEVDKGGFAKGAIPVVGVEGFGVLMPLSVDRAGTKTAAAEAAKYVDGLAAYSKEFRTEG